MDPAPSPPMGAPSTYTSSPTAWDHATDGMERGPWGPASGPASRGAPVVLLLVVAPAPVPALCPPPPQDEHAARATSIAPEPSVAMDARPRIARRRYTRPD